MDFSDNGVGNNLDECDSNNAVEDAEQDLEWEEWDGRSPFLHHCVAGSIAGVAEHTLLYPVDTIKTHMQSYCAECPQNPNKVHQISSHNSLSNSSSSLRPTNGGMWTTMRNLLRGTTTTITNANATATATSQQLRVSRPATNLAASAVDLSLSSTSEHVLSSFTRSSYLRLWRGVQTMAVGCVPAHALYFSSYEAVKAGFVDDQGRLSPLGSSVAGATATVFHDLVMTPLDTIKQRLQLGHYGGMAHGIRHVLRHEGYGGLYRSFPITLATNVPYGIIMVSTNEFLKHVLSSSRGGATEFDLHVSLTAGCGAGFVASALTTPLDRVKTRLQTQAMGNGSYGEDLTSGACRKRTECRGPMTQAKYLANTTTSSSSPARYVGWRDSLQSILRQEGAMGLCRGMVPRVLMHSPAVAISWTSYEGAKKYLSEM